MLLFTLDIALRLLRNNKIRNLVLMARKRRAKPFNYSLETAIIALRLCANCGTEDFLKGYIHWW